MRYEDNCEACNKSSLAFFLLRPSPIARARGLAPSGSEAVVSSEELAMELLPKRLPTESRIILRSLRPGYVYVYIEKPAIGKQWLVFRVSEQGAMVPESSTFFDRPMELTCSRKEHNPEGLQLISIPRAYKISEFWIAFSANRWNDKVMKRNAANPQQMQRVALEAPPSYAFLPMADALKNRVLECAVRSLKLGGMAEHDFPFNPIKNPNNLADSLFRAAATHPMTSGRQLAIVLRDPVAFATELNALRLLRNELVKQEAAKPANEHPLNSSQTLMGIKAMIENDALERAADSLCQVVSKKTFEGTIKTSKYPHYAGALWIPFPADRKNFARDGTPLGRVWTREARKNYLDSANRLKARNRERVTSEYDEEARIKWLGEFQAKLKREHYEPLERYEADWWAACKDAQFESYFEQHFDENCPNSPNAAHSPGCTYAQETARATTPAPLTDGNTCSEYAKQLMEDATKPSAILLRALGANQPAVIKAIAGLNALHAGAAHIHSERNDKLYDLSASLVHMSGTPIGQHGVMAQYSWLAVAFGNLMGGYTLAIAESLAGAVTAIGLRLGAEYFRSAHGQQMLVRLQNIQMVQRAMEMATHSVVSGAALKTPILISKTYAFADLMQIVGPRPGSSIDQLRTLTTNGTLKVDLLTTADEMAGYGDDIDHAITQGAGRVRLDGEVIPAILASPRAARTVHFTDAQWEQALKSRGKIASSAVYWIRESMQGGSTILGGLEGRLALGAILINGVSLWLNLSRLQQGTGTAEQLRDARLGMIDASASVIAGLTQALEVAAKASVAGRLGEAAVKKSVSIHTLRATGLVLGVCAGFVTTVAQFMKALDAFDDNQLGVAGLYSLSGLAFLGTTAMGGVAATGAIADRLVAKQVAGAVARNLSLRFGTQGMAVIAGGSAQGWGLGLLASAIVFEVGAVVLTPTEMQEWVQRSYFGYGDAKEPKFATGDWTSEREALKRLLPAETDNSKSKVHTTENA